MTELKRVAAAECGDYLPENVQRAVDAVLDRLGGIQSIVPRNAKVFVKVNLVREMSPDKCGTTHPEVVVALCNRLLTVTDSVTVGDSCAGLYTKGMLGAVYSKCGMTQVEQRTAARLNQNFNTVTAQIDGVALSQCELTDAFMSADVVINVGKLKTHTFAGYTGAVKNLFGLIPGLVKVEMHSRFPDLPDFCNLLCDLERFAHGKIVLNVIDAVWGMDGEGPTNGTPKFIGQIIASADAYAADAVAVSLFCNDPLSMPVLQTAVKRGYIQADLSDVDFDFAAWRRCFISDFKTVQTVSGGFFDDRSPLIRKLAKKLLTQKVHPDSTCRGCGKCARHCPAQAIKIVRGKAKVNQSKCIRCYCCQELCPFNAVRLKKSLAYVIARRISGKKVKSDAPKK